MTIDRRRPSRIVRARRGAAMLLVITVVAICAVLGYAMLASASLKSIVSYNAVRILRADALAESGVNLGVYYLRYMDEPQLAGLKSTGQLSLAGVSLGPDVPGTFDVSISRIHVTDSNGVSVPTNDYEVVSVGHSSAGAESVSQVLRAVVRVQYRFRAHHAMNVNGPLTVRYPMEIYQGAGAVAYPGDFHRSIQSPSPVYLDSGAVVEGDISAPAPLSISDASFSGQLRDAPTMPVAPSASTTRHPQWGDLKVYGPAYEYGGNKNCAAAVITGGTLPVITSDNPLGVYYSPGDLTIMGAALADLLGEVTGATLVVNGNLTIGDANQNAYQELTLTPRAGAPALVVHGNLIFAADAKVLTLKGLTYIGGVIQSPAVDTSGCALNVEGSLLIANGPTASLDPIDPMYQGALRLTLTPENVDLPDFCRNSNQDVEGIALISFSSSATP